MHSCHVSFFDAHYIEECQGIANYIFISYRYIPSMTTTLVIVVQVFNWSFKPWTSNLVASQNTIELTKESAASGSSLIPPDMETGVLTSENYPEWTPDVEIRALLYTPDARAFKIYFTDISFEDDTFPGVPMSLDDDDVYYDVKPYVHK